MINRKYQAITRWFIVATLVIVLGFDAWVMFVGGTGTTISHELINWPYKYPIMGCLVGIVLGHLMWRMPSTVETAEHDPMVRAALEAMRDVRRFDSTHPIDDFFAKYGTPEWLGMKDRRDV